MKMTKLRKSAEGQPCLIRIPNVCNFDSSTTVLSHIRRGHVAGMGQKPADMIACFACSDCHNEIDKRNNMGSYTPSEMDGFILEGMCRTLAWWNRNGYFK